MEADFIAGLGDSNVETRIFSIQRLGGLKLASSRPVLREVIETRKGIEAEWAVYARCNKWNAGTDKNSGTVLAQSETKMVGFRERGAWKCFIMNSALHVGA